MAVMREVLTIAEIGHRGDGVAHTPGGAVFVPYALPGEKVAVEAAPDAIDRRRLVAIESESPERVAPLCAHFGQCGGCTLQHWETAAYSEWKRGLVRTALAQAGITAEVDPLFDAHGEGRRRVVLHARRGQGGVMRVGFSAPRAHEIILIDACPVLAPALHGALDVARSLVQPLASTNKPVDIHITATDAGLDVDLRGTGKLTPAVQTALTSVAARLRLARLTRHGEMIMQASPPRIMMGKASVLLPPAAFLQATARGEEVLAGLVDQHTSGVRRIADLFAGVGPFALRLAERARMHAVDSDAGAIAALANAARAASGLKGVTTEIRDLFRLPLSTAELRDYDAVVFDPPRQGAAAQARELAASMVPTVVAISCNPATFARDARTLIDGGYSLQRVTPVNQFRYSAHVEIVALFDRR
jgi:23S rRNA (uracil1939-C5)-methyltransferase